MNKWWNEVKVQSVNYTTPLPVSHDLYKERYLVGQSTRCPKWVIWQGADISDPACRVGCMLSSMSRWAGFKQSMHTVSLQPLMFTMKCLSVHLTTGYGPSYGGCWGLCTASCWKNTCVAVDKASVTWLFLCVGQGVMGKQAACEPWAGKHNSRGQLEGL